MTVYGLVTDDRLTAASAVFSAAVGQSEDKWPAPHLSS